MSRLFVHCPKSAKYTLISLKMGLLLQVVEKGLEPPPVKLIHSTAAIQKLSTVHRAYEDNCCCPIPSQELTHSCNSHLVGKLVKIP